MQRKNQNFFNEINHLELFFVKILEKISIKMNNLQVALKVASWVFGTKPGTFSFCAPRVENHVDQSTPTVHVALVCVRAERVLRGGCVKALWRERGVLGAYLVCGRRA